MMDTDVRKLLQSLADTAANAAEEAKTAVQSASKAMAEKYDTVKLTLELSRLRTQQERLFADMGRTLFFLKTGAVKADEAVDGDKTTQQAIDSILLSAEQVQQQIDAINDKISAAKNELVCSGCGRLCDEHDAFCAVCGTKL